MSKKAHVLDRANRLSDVLQPRITQLGLKSWQLQVYGLIVLQAYESPCFKRWDEQRHQLYKEVNDVVDLLERFETMERLALLHLAVWKSECLSDHNKELQTYMDYANWCRSGWKDRKSVKKRHSAMNTIALCVLPFLAEQTDRQYSIDAVF